MIIIPEDALRIAEALSAPIDELGLSVRSYNGLRRWGITTVADVYRAYQNKQLPRIRNLGEKSVIEIEKHLEEHLAKVAHVNTSETPNSSDTISRQAAIDALWKALYEYEDKTEKQFQESEDLDVGDWILHRIFVQNMSDIDRQTILNLPSAEPERTCVNCGRTANNGGWYADGRTRCPIEEHYALPKDGYCHLWEKRNVTDDDYPERREE